MQTRIIKIKNRVDDQGRPAGGEVVGTGLTIVWQDGPLGRDDDRLAPNGAFVEDVIRAAINRIAFYQDGPFNCQENADAYLHLNIALNALNSRTARRETAGVEGTHEGT
jgi:hypothetical protein